MPLTYIHLDTEPYEVRHIPIADFLSNAYQQVHCQRNQVLRYSTSKKYLEKVVGEHFNIAVIRYVGAQTAYYTPGNFYVVDGNTRRYHWQQCVANNSGEVPETIRVSIFDAATEDEIKERYYRYDSSDAVEKTSHKLQGALAAHNIVLKSKGLKNGSFSMALRIATPSDDDLFDKVLSAKEALHVADNIPSFGTIGSVRMGFALAIIRYYSETNTTRTYDHDEYLRAIDGITKMCSGYMVDTSKEKDGITWITKEWVSPVYIIDKGTGVTKLPEQLAYLAYFFNHWMLGNNMTQYRAKSGTMAWAEIVKSISAI